MRLPLQHDRPLVFFDLETTGVRPREDRIVEMALIKITPEGDVTEKVRRFNPGIPIPPGATKVHGITDADVADEAPFASRARSLVRLLEGCDLAGFNVRRFDIPMLLAEFERAEVDFSVKGRRLIDVQQIFHNEEPRDLTAAARFYLGREHPEAHTALGDIRTSAAVLGAQLERYDHLPRDIDGLHAYCDAVGKFETELDRWFQERDDGERVFRRGKHRGSTLDEVATLHADYLQWMTGLDDLDTEVIRVVEAAIVRVREGTAGESGAEGRLDPASEVPTTDSDPVPTDEEF